MKNKYVICAERESVCMGDDCTAPHTSYLEYEPSERLFEFMGKIAKYLPSMHNVVWSVDCDGTTIAYLTFDAECNCRFELAMSNVLVSELPEQEIFCRYYYDGKLDDENLPSNLSLLEKVKEYERKR